MLAKNKWAILSCVLLILIAGTAFRNAIAASLFRMFVAPKINEQLAETYVPIEPDPSSEATVLQPEPERGKSPITFLLLGVDQRGKERGRSDTMMFGVFLPESKDLTLVSIPRDSYIYLPEEGRYDKATHAYAYGGAKGAVKAVERLLDQPIDYYVSINFKGVVEMVDSLGGIELNIGKDLVNDDPDHEKFVVKAGQDKYMGVDALNYLRYREDAGGDLSRAARNQEFIAALLKKAKSFENLTKVSELLGIVGDNLQTNMPPGDITERIADYIGDNEKSLAIHSTTLSGHGAWKDKVWYLELDEVKVAEARLQIDELIRQADLPSVQAEAASSLSPIN
ncbi:LCP family protein [Paenibacillus thermotolerans]|uniref:LCP family protein n=1 Tax=Paenibacillus thermotolerans TaxID=3027807 RepID=UPI002368F12B|nr:MULTISPECIES: LCP family protein [unclassified Paenibacillus]